MLRKAVDSFKLHPFQNGAIVLILILVASMGFLQISGKGTKSVNETSVVVLPKDTKDILLPTLQGKDDNSDASLASDALNISIDFDLPQNLSKMIDNISIGIRNPEGTTARGGVVPTAHAQEGSYPVVYYVNYLYDSKSVQEINMITGETKTVIQEDERIGSLSFNNKSQSLTYDLFVSDSGGENTVSHKIVYFNLKTKKRTVLAEGWNLFSRWSPNGKHISYTRGISTDTSETLGLSVYDLKSGSTKNYNWPSGEVYRQTIVHSWTLNSDYIVAMLDTPLGDDNYYEIYRLSVESGVWEKISNKIARRSMPSSRDLAPLMIGKKLYMGVYNLSELGEQERPSANDDLNWFAFYDTSKKTFTQFRDDTGDFMHDWLVNRDGTRLVFSLGTGNEQKGSYVRKLEYFDIENRRTIKVLPNLSGRYRIIGWNGNEENVVLWDQYNTFYNVNVKTGKLTRITRQ